MTVAGTKECLRRFLLTSSCDPRILARSPPPPQRTARITTHRMSSTASIHNQHIRRELLLIDYRRTYHFHCTGAPRVALSHHQHAAHRQSTQPYVHSGGVTRPTAGGKQHCRGSAPIFLQGIDVGWVGCSPAPDADARDGNAPSILESCTCGAARHIFNFVGLLGPHAALNTVDKRSRKNRWTSTPIVLTEICSHQPSWRAAQ